MRMGMFAVSMLAILVGHLAWALPDSKPDAGPSKEPKYHGKPAYLLLHFGKDATPVWMVRDGETLYVDHNGNGDLTEPGERLEGRRENVPQRRLKYSAYFETSVRGFKGVQYEIVYTAGSDGFSGTLEVSTTFRGDTLLVEKCDTNNRLWASKPFDAKPLHFNGPLELEYTLSTHPHGPKLMAWFKKRENKGSTDIRMVTALGKDFPLLPALVKFTKQPEQPNDDAHGPSSGITTAPMLPAAARIGDKIVHGLVMFQSFPVAENERVGTWWVRVEWFRVHHLSISLREAYVQAAWDDGEMKATPREQVREHAVPVWDRNESAHQSDRD